MALFDDLSTIFGAYATKINSLKSNLGNIANLDTSVKTSIVDAINAAQADIDDVKTDLESVGLTDDIKVALLACFANVGWQGGSSPFYINRLRAALYGETEPEKFFTNGLGLTVSSNVPTVATNTKRGLLYQKEGTTPLLSSVQGVNNVYPIHIPQGATGVKFHGMQTTDYISINLQIMLYENDEWIIKRSAGFAKIVPDTLSRTEIAGYNNGNYYMIGTYGISDATHTSPLDGTVTIDTSDFTMEVVAE